MIRCVEVLSVASSGLSCVGTFVSHVLLRLCDEFFASEREVLLMHDNFAYTV